MCTALLSARSGHRSRDPVYRNRSHLYEWTVGTQPETIQARVPSELGNHGETGAGRDEEPKKCASFAPLIVRGRSANERFVLTCGRASERRVQWVPHRHGPLYIQAVGGDAEKGRKDVRKDSEQEWALPGPVSWCPPRSTKLPLRRYAGECFPGAGVKRGEAMMRWWAVRRRRVSLRPRRLSGLRHTFALALAPEGSPRGPGTLERLCAGLDGYDRAGGSGPGARA